MPDSTSSAQLKRELGLFGAILMGLGSIVGTGIFVSTGLAANIAGTAALAAIVLGAIVATCNGLSSAQLAANHAVSGGTYEYGYRYLNHWLGFIAGWMFLLAKSASAATAALGFAGYLLGAFGVSDRGAIVVTALVAVVVLTLVVLKGIRRSNTTNIAIVSTTLAVLAIFVVTGLPTLIATNFSNLAVSSGEFTWRSLLEASALMFVAYTGYGRIATLGEEVVEPRKTIPRAIIVTLGLIMVLYAAVATVGIGAVGASAFGNATISQVAPLEVAARSFGIPGIPQILAIGAITAMLGVLLNLILGLSRVLLAMGRRRDMPAITARLNADRTTPSVAVIVVGIAIALLVLIGNVKTTWSFSAFNVLIYYAITNLAALQLTRRDRLYPRWISALGLLFCLFLAFWVEPQIWSIGLALIVAGTLWHGVAWHIRHRD